MTTTLKYKNKKIKNFYRSELRKYEAEIGDITVEEREALHKWVADGYSPYENPCTFCDDDGYVMDYIRAIRIEEDMQSNPEAYFRQCTVTYEYADGDVPF